jgi:hypothetical protein
MKQLISKILIVILAVTTWGCGSGNKSKQVKEYKYTEEKVAVNDSIDRKVGSWIKEGMICYGIVISLDPKGNPSKVKEIEAKVISIQPDLIKMKSMEDVVIAPIQGCTKVGMKKGEMWDEKEGDLFRTREEAVKYIETKYPDHQFLIE